MLQKLKNIIENINKLYKTRDIESLKNEYDSLFEQDAILIGTSPAEVCTNKEDIIKLFASDFEGWGDFNINQEPMKTQETGDFLFASFKSTLKISFKDNPNIFNVFSHVIKENDEFIDNKKTAALKNIWLLQHILKNRNEENRSYLWEFDFHLILSKQNTKIKLIHFSYPFEQDFYDVLLGVDPYDDSMFEKELGKFKDNVPDLVSNVIDQISQTSSKEFQVLAMLQTTSEKEHVFAGVGTVSYKFDYDAFYKHVMGRTTEDENALFHVHRDLAYGLMLETLNPIKAPFRIIGIYDQEKVLVHLITYPYQIILENKSHKEQKL